MDGVDHDGDEVDLTGLMESIVDSDEEEDLAESIDVNGSFNFSSLCTRAFLSSLSIYAFSSSLTVCWYFSSLTNQHCASPQPSMS